MEPFPDVLVVRRNDGRVFAVCSGCVQTHDKVEGKLAALVHNDLIMTHGGYATIPHEYE